MQGLWLMALGLSGAQVVCLGCCFLAHEQGAMLSRPEASGAELWSQGCQAVGPDLWRGRGVVGDLGSPRPHFTSLSIPLRQRPVPGGHTAQQLLVPQC